MDKTQLIRILCKMTVEFDSLSIRVACMEHSINEGFLSGEAYRFRVHDIKEHLSSLSQYITFLAEGLETIELVFEKKEMTYSHIGRDDVTIEYECTRFI